MIIIKDNIINMISIINTNIVSIIKIGFNIKVKHTSQKNLSKCLQQVQSSNHDLRDDTLCWEIGPEAPVGGTRLGLLMLNVRVFLILVIFTVFHVICLVWSGHLCSLSNRL